MYIYFYYKNLVHRNIFRFTGILFVKRILLSRNKTINNKLKLVYSFLFNSIIISIIYKDQNHKALYDEYKLTYEKLEALEEKVNEINKKVERQDVEIRVIRSPK